MVWKCCIALNMVWKCCNQNIKTNFFFLFTNPCFYIKLSTFYFYTKVIRNDLNLVYFCRYKMESSIDVFIVETCYCWRQLEWNIFLCVLFSQNLLTFIVIFFYISFNLIASSDFINRLASCFIQYEINKDCSNYTIDCENYHTTFKWNYVN